VSTLKVAAINNPSALSGGLAISATGLVSGAGLDLITSQSFTAASAVNVNNCFSSAYDNYRIIITHTSSSTATSTGFRMRAAGADNSTANYQWRRTDLAGTVTTAAGTTDTSASNGIAISSTITAVCFEVCQPFLSTVTFGTSLGFRESQTATVGMFLHNVASSFDGFSLNPTTGTLTGTLRVYGYEN
jgi:hypothetical protein